MSRDSSYAVSGLTCGHCVGAVTEETLKIPGVVQVSVDLRPESSSILTVTHDQPIDVEAVQLAVEEAGYTFDDPIELTTG